jgi:hypothetical protein
MRLHVIASRRGPVVTNGVKSVLPLNGEGACNQSSCAPSYHTSFSKCTVKEVSQIVK